MAKDAAGSSRTLMAVQGRCWLSKNANGCPRTLLALQNADDSRWRLFKDVDANATTLIKPDELCTIDRCNATICPRSNVQRWPVSIVEGPHELGGEHWVVLVVHHFDMTLKPPSCQKRASSCFNANQLPVLQVQAGSGRPNPFGRVRACPRRRG